MSTTPLHLLLRGPFNFLSPTDAELRDLVPDYLTSLPQPQQVFLEEENRPPVYGFPVLQSSGLRALAQALEEYIQAEEEAQVAVMKRQAFDRRVYGGAWDRYRALFARAVENVTLSSSGRHHPAVFWLDQSSEIARLLKETPKRVLRLDLHVGREHGEAIRYRVLERLLDRVLSVTYDVVNGLAFDTDEIEEQLFPPLFTRLRDNVLIFTETHVSPNLAELGGYFNGCLRIDGRDLRSRLDALVEWHAQQLRSDYELRSAVRHLLGSDPDGESRDLLRRPGYLTYISGRPQYDARRLLDPAQVQVYESLLRKLKEFELFDGLRRLVLPLDRSGESLVCHDVGASRSGRSVRTLVLSGSTRPMDFMSGWVVDPRVERCGMIYDLTSFSEIISRLRWSGSEEQDNSFRMIFRFQRKINRFAYSHRLKLEKYLGDGAFYSARDARRVLICAIHTQRHYHKIVDEGFPFNRGLRIALNYGQYRLLPIQSSMAADGERYEFFGHGVVELSRLTTGKGVRDLDEIKILLLNLGYPEATVNRFFAPLLGDNMDVVDKREESRPFYAYLNQNGTLINEGIVATAAFIDRLSREGGVTPVWRALEQEREYAVISVPDAAGAVDVGLRRLGVASLKGLDKLPVYEVIDAQGLERGAQIDSQGADLVAVLEREFANNIGVRRPHA